MHFRYMSQRSPIHGLPVELLSDIFLLGTSPSPTTSDTTFLLKPDDSFSYAPSTSFQILVSHVCSHWRQVALRTASLWTSLHFREPTHLARAKIFLSRTQSSSPPLDILVDTVAWKDHIPGITLCREEFHAIFDIITPFVNRWRSFFLKVRDNECKAGARLRLSTCGPAPALETLQLYHFEDWRTSQNLYLATVRPPVVVFDGQLPHLKNVSLIGVNLPWDNAPFLSNLRNLELALHSESVRPTYEQWERMLRSSPLLEKLSLHYSGPRLPLTISPNITTGITHDSWPTSRDPIRLPYLVELTLTDLDPYYLCLLFEHLAMPVVRRLSLDLPEQDFTPFVEMIAGVSGKDEVGSDNTHTPSSVSNKPFFSKMDTLVVAALECSANSWKLLLESMRGLKVLEVDFERVGVMFFSVLVGEHHFADRHRHPVEANPTPNRSLNHVPLLPVLTTIRLSGLPGTKVKELISYRESCGHRVARWCVNWCPAWRGRDKVLDELVTNGWVADEIPGEGSCGDGCLKNRVSVEWFLEDEDEEEDIGEASSISVWEDEGEDEESP